MPGSATSPPHEVINDTDWIKGVIEQAVAMREREILKVRGTTPAGAVAQAILGTIHSIITPTPFGHGSPRLSSPTEATVFPEAWFSAFP